MGDYLAELNRRYDPRDAVPGHDFGFRQVHHTLWNQPIFGGKYNVDVDVQLRKLHDGTYDARVMGITEIWPSSASSKPITIERRKQPEYMAQYQDAMLTLNEEIYRHYQGEATPQKLFIPKDPPAPGKTDVEKIPEKLQENVEQSVGRRLQEQKPGEPLPPASEAEIAKEKRLKDMQKTQSWNLPQYAALDGDAIRVLVGESIPAQYAVVAAHDNYRELSWHTLEEFPVELQEKLKALAVGDVYMLEHGDTMLPFFAQFDAADAIKRVK